jgi:GMP synthase PP-ATPase subunit
MLFKRHLRKNPLWFLYEQFQTHNFLTAEVTQIPWLTVAETAEEIMKKCPNVFGVCYDVTFKPPATIEME